MTLYKLGSENTCKKRGKYFPITVIFFLTITLLISSTTTLIDAAGDSTHKSNSVVFDRFGISIIYPTIENGREFFSHWDEGGERILNFNDRDPIDSDLVIKGKNPKVSIDGKGIATLEGKDPDLVANPRIYIYDEQRQKTWNNVEITFYQKRISEHTPLSYSGLNVGARSEHQDVTEENLSTSETYYGRFTNDGRIQFVKEIEHGTYVNSSEVTYPWNNPEGNLPLDTWIGIKYVVRTLESSGNVKFELFMDTTDGIEGGSWNKVNDFIEDGKWGGQEVFREPSTSVFIKNDGLGMAQYKNFSVREITPLL